LRNSGGHFYVFFGNSIIYLKILSLQISQIASSDKKILKKTDSLLQDKKMSSIFAPALKE
jgi:hypothetical protein